MSVAEIGQLHTRYVRLSEKFKAVWTYNQFATGVFKNFLQAPLPYRIDFQKIYESLKTACDVIQSSTASGAVVIMDQSEKELQGVLRDLIAADERISPSIVRRFFEKVRRQDEKIIFNLIKFYLYAGAVEGDPRDKLDFLFTRIAEDFVEERGEYSVKDSLELRKLFQSLLSVRPAPPIEQQEVVDLIRAIRGLRDEIARSGNFEDLTGKDLLNQARALKQTLRNRIFHPDILLAIVDANITTKNRFSALYRDEEQKIVDDARKLLDSEPAIARGFGDTNPDLLDELERFKRFKQEFDDSRLNSNVKHGVIAQLKTSMNNILAQLDRGLDTAEPEPLSESFFLDVQHADSIQSRFGEDPVLHEHLLKIVTALDAMDRHLSHDRIANAPECRALRLEPWEIAAFQKLYSERHRREGETDDLLLLYLRAAALRMKIDQEANDLAAIPAHKTADPGLLENIKASLDRAKELDMAFRDFLQEGISYSNPKNVHRLYRSRLRLLRGFSGLWLLYDQHAGND